MSDRAPAPDLSAPWSDFLQQGLLGREPLLDNADIEIRAVPCGPQLTPLVTNRSGLATCSWVASLRNAYGPYARAETDIVRMNRWLRPLYLAGSHAAEALLAAGALSGGNFLGNWLLATNLHSKNLTADIILATTLDVARADPELPVVIRSLTPPLHGKLIEELATAGFLLLPSRQVWIVPSPASGEWRTHRDMRRDLALAETSSALWRWIPATEFTAADFTRSRQLFQQLYRQRYPQHNPDYTEHFFRTGVATGWLELTGLRPAAGGPLSGVIGMIHRDGVSCTPLLGYDLAASPKLGLYRLLTLKAFLTSEALGTCLHCSSGAGAFKFSRGAQPHLEFAAIWARHLPIYRRLNLHLLRSAINRCVAPYLATHRL